MDWNQVIGLVIDVLKQYGVRGMRLKEIASIAATDPSELDRRIRRATGKTSKQIINEGRKRLVVQMIREGRKGYEIASALGFKSEQSFYRWVKRQFGKPFKELVKEVSAGNLPPPPRRRRLKSTTRAVSRLGRSPTDPRRIAVHKSHPELSPRNVIQKSHPEMIHFFG